MLSPNQTDTIVKAAASLSCASICAAGILGICYSNLTGWQLLAVVGICVFSIGGSLSVLERDKKDGKPTG